MALKPTIYKLRIALSDLERNYYDTLNLTVAQHPSETLERMMVRILAYCINAQENLVFGNGLCEPDKPDIQAHALDDQAQLWIDVGEPALERIRKATRIAAEVKVYSFNAKSDTWWSQEGSKFGALDAEIYQVQWKAARALAALVDRTMDCSVTISGESAYVATAKGECEVAWKRLQG